MRKSNIVSIKEINKKNILKIIIAKKSISRIDISRLLKISRPTVSAYVTELINDNLVKEYGKDSSTSLGGKKAVLLNFNYNAGYIIAVSIGVLSIRVAITNLNAEILSLSETKTEEEKGSSFVISKVIKLIKSILKKNGDKKEKIIGIGIACTGLVDSAAGKVIFSPNLTGWSNISLKEIIEKKTGIITFIENECRINAIAEKNYGLAKQTHNFVCFLVGRGIGAGAFMKNKLFVCEKGLAGEIGHLTTNLESNKRCHCGGVGCLEAISSTVALLSNINEELSADANKHSSKRIDQIAYEDLFELYKKRNKIITKHVEENARLIGTGISNVIKIFNPQLIIIHGTPIKFGEKYLQIVRETVSKITFPKVKNTYNIKFSELGDKVKLLGASGFVFNNIFQLEEFNLANEYIVKNN